MHYKYDEKHNLTFRFDSGDGERSLEMNCSEFFLGDILFRFEEFLKGCGYEFNGQIGVVNYEDEPHTLKEPWPSRPIGEHADRNYDEYKLDQPLKHEPKWDFSNIPNNNWPFGGLTSEPIPSLTTAQVSSFQSISIDALKASQYPTMAPLTKEQIEAFTFKPEEQIEAFKYKTELPGTLGGAKVENWAPREERPSNELRAKRSEDYQK